MLLRKFYYPNFLLDFITLRPDEVWEFPTASMQYSYGSLYMRGCITPQNKESGPEILEHPEWRPKKDWNVFKAGHDLGETIKFKASEKGAKWCCLSSKEQFTVEHAVLPAAVPAGVSALIIQDAPMVLSASRVIKVPHPSGLMTVELYQELAVVEKFDQAVVGPGVCFGPQSEDIKIDGIGDILFIGVSS